MRLFIVVRGRSSKAEHGFHKIIRLELKRVPLLLSDTLRVRFPSPAKKIFTYSLRIEALMSKTLDERKGISQIKILLVKKIRG